MPIELVDLADDGAPIGPELGSGFDAGARIFGSYAGGAIFNPSEWTVRDIDGMLAVDGHMRSLERVLTLPMQGAKWRLVPPDGDTGQTDTVNDVLTRPANNGGMSIPLELVIAQMTAAVGYRRSYHEKVWRADGGRIVLDKLAWRPPASCWLDRDDKTGAFQGFKQRVVEEGKVREVLIPPPRALVYIHGQSRNPLLGTSDLDVAYNCWQSKQKVRFLWYAFLEGQVVPKAVYTHDKAGDDAGREENVRKVAKLKGGGVVGLSPQQKLDPFASSGQGAAVFEAAMRYLDEEAALSIIAQFLTLTGNVGRGSFALSADQTDFFLQSRQADLVELGATLTAYLVADIVRWNHGPTAPVPTFRFGDLAADASQRALAMLQAIAAAPAVNLPPSFVSQLTELVAGYLGMDTARVSAELQAGVGAGATPGQQLHTAVDQAARMVQEARSGTGAGGQQQPGAAVPAVAAG